MNLYLTDKKYIHRNLPHFGRVFCFGNGKPHPKVTWIDTVKHPKIYDVLGAANNRSPNDINVIGDRYYDSSIKKLNFVNLYGKCVQIGKSYSFQGRINIQPEGDFKTNLHKNYEVLKLKKIKIAKRYDNIIAVTSISPYHKNFQQQYEAVTTWNKYFRVYSVNTETEIKLLKRKFKDVDFVTAKNTLKELTGKDVVCIRDMIDLGKEKKKDVLIINSDIVLKDFPEPKKGLGIITRHNYTEEISDSKPFPHGFDAFLIPYEYLNIYPPSLYAMGVCWWDYMIPYRAIVKGVKVYFVKDKIAYHKNHQVQYHPNEWKLFGEYFRWENRLTQFENIGEMGAMVGRAIRENMGKKKSLTIKIAWSLLQEDVTLEKVKAALAKEEVDITVV